MEKSQMYKLLDQGCELGKKSKYLKEKYNKILLLDLLVHGNFDDFLNKIMQLCVEEGVEIPIEFIKFQDDEDQFIKIGHIFMQGIQKGSLSESE